MSSTMWNSSMIADAVESINGPESGPPRASLAAILAAQYMEANEYDPSEVMKESPGNTAAFVYDVLYWATTQATGIEVRLTVKKEGE